MNRLIKPLKIANLLLLSGMWVLVLMVYSDLPQIIPTHFNSSGDADRFGKKTLIWTLPAVATVLLLFLDYLAERPQSPLLSIPDAMRQQADMVKLFVGCLTTTMLLIFFSICLEVVATDGFRLDLGFAIPALLFLLFAFYLKINSIARRRRL